MTTTNKGGGSIPGSKNRFDVKPEIFVLQVDGGTSATQGSTHAQRENKCKKQKKHLLKYHPHGFSTATGWSSTTKTQGQDTMISPPLLNF